MPAILSHLFVQRPVFVFSADAIGVLQSGDIVAHAASFFHLNKV